MLENLINKIKKRKNIIDKNNKIVILNNDSRNSLLFVGQPAKIVKENVNWDMQNTYFYQKENIKNHYKGKA